MDNHQAPWEFRAMINKESSKKRKAESPGEEKRFLREDIPTPEKEAELQAKFGIISQEFLEGPQVSQTTPSPTGLKPEI